MYIIIIIIPPLSPSSIHLPPERAPEGAELCPGLWQPEVSRAASDLEDYGGQRRPGLRGPKVSRMMWARGVRGYASQRCPGLLCPEVYYYVSNSGRNHLQLLRALIGRLLF